MLTCHEPKRSELVQFYHGFSMFIPFSWVSQWVSLQLCQLFSWHRCEGFQVRLYDLTQRSGPNSKDCGWSPSLPSPAQECPPASPRKGAALAAPYSPAACVLLPPLGGSPRCRMSAGATWAVRLYRPCWTCHRASLRHEHPRYTHGTGAGGLRIEPHASMVCRLVTPLTPTFSGIN